MSLLLVGEGLHEREPISLLFIPGHSLGGEERGSSFSQLLQKAIKKARNSDNLLPDEKFLENYLDIVNDEITNLNTIVLDFLFAVRPIKATMELIDPNTIITRIINLFNPEFQENKIHLLCSLADIEKKLLIDRKLFKEVLANLF